MDLYHTHRYRSIERGTTETDTVCEDIFWINNEADKLGYIAKTVYDGYNYYNFNHMPNRVYGTNTLSEILQKQNCSLESAKEFQREYPIFKAIDDVLFKIGIK